MRSGKFRVNPEWVIPALFRFEAQWCYDWVIELCKQDPRLIGHISQHRNGYIHFLCIVAIVGIHNKAVSRDKMDAILAEFSKVNIDNRWITGLRYMIRFSDWNTFLKDS